MQFYWLWPIPVITGLAYIVASVGPFRALGNRAASARDHIQALDGLRGFLALAVFLHHAAIYHLYLLTGRWEPPPSAVYAFLGPAGVSVFFMITGYLFWSQMLRAGGRPDWFKLYIGRAFRILPLYWVAAALVVIGVFVATGFHMKSTPLAFAHQLAEWACGGYFDAPPINGYARTPMLIAGVLWSLHYEWLFYLSLLATGWFARERLGKVIPLALVGVTGVALAMRHATDVVASPTACVFLFACGMSTAAFETVLRRLKPSDRAGSWACCGMALAAGFCGRGDAYALTPLGLLALTFVLIASGTTIFRLLATAPAKRLGDISYGLYLLQGSVLAAVFAFPAVRVFALASPGRHWLVISGACLVLVGAAALAHVYVERPGIEAGRRLIAQLRSRPASAERAAA